MFVAPPLAISMPNFIAFIWLLFVAAVLPNAVSFNQSNVVADLVPYTCSLFLYSYSPLVLLDFSFCCHKWFDISYSTMVALVSKSLAKGSFIDNISCLVCDLSTGFATIFL